MTVLSVGGVFKMWQEMRRETCAKSAVLVSPYNHGDGYHKELGVAFPNGKRREGFGEGYQIAWFDHIRSGSPIPFEKGVVSYYRAFENNWASDFYKTATKPMEISLGRGECTFVYDPKDPPALREEGVFAEDLSQRRDIVTLCTKPFEKNTFVKGQMKVKLAVESSAPDTSFYVRISIQKPQYTYVLRHDITSLCYQLGDYVAGERVELQFTFDEYAFLIEAGERLQIDVTSTNDNGYVCHTNQKGAYYLQTDIQVATNKIDLDRSCLILPVEE